MFSFPPTNHFAKGRSHSSVVWNGSFQVTVSRAIRAQKASGSAPASSYSDGPALAWALNAGSGGNVRPSARRFSISGRWSTLTGDSCRADERRGGLPCAVRPFYAGDPPMPGRTIGPSLVDRDVRGRGTTPGAPGLRASSASVPRGSSATAPQAAPTAYRHRANAAGPGQMDVARNVGPRSQTRSGQLAAATAASQ